MRTVGLTILEALLVLVIGVGVGVGMNSVRGRNSIHLRQNYFPKRPSETIPAIPPPPNGAVSTTQATSSAPSTQANTLPASLPAHPYQVVTFEEVRELYNESTTQLGRYVFIDARKDEDFLAGHIPGAIQCDRLRLADYIDNVKAYAGGAEKVIVYCNGGTCDDSIFLCDELVNDGIVLLPNILLYAGGWEDWKAKQGPSVTGRESAP